MNETAELFTGTKSVRNSEQWPGPSRRAVLAGTAALVAVVASFPAEAQKITVEVTKRRIELANNLYILDAKLLTEAGAIKIGYKPEESRALLTGDADQVNRHIDLLLNGEPETGMGRELSVAVQFALSDLKDRWAVYGANLAALVSQTDISEEGLAQIADDSHEFSAKVKELVDIIYDVYGKTIFSADELRAVTFLATGRAYIEEMGEIMVFATAFPAKKPEYMAELLSLGEVFAQTIDVLVRNGAMFGVAPPPSPEALAALEMVEANWAPNWVLIEEIAANGNITMEELEAFSAKSQSVSEELDRAIAAFNAALPRT